jgi:hypothetical protein
MEGRSLGLVDPLDSAVIGRRRGFHRNERGRVELLAGFVGLLLQGVDVLAGPALEFAAGVGEIDSRLSRGGFGFFCDKLQSEFGNLVRCILSEVKDSSVFNSI